MESHHPSRSSRPGAAERSSDPRDAHRSDVGARDIVTVVDSGGPTIVYQPIRRCSDHAVVGYEALSRFDHGGPPDVWFRAAATLGLSAELEAAALSRALAETAHIPPDKFVAVNVSPGCVLDGAVQALLTAGDDRAIVVEITEGAAIEVGDAVHCALIDLRTAGTRLALDDVGTGHAGLRQILTVQPDLIKIDATFAHGIDADPTRQAIARAMVTFSRDAGTQCSFEGVETCAELTAIVECGGELAQGFLLGRPGPLPDDP